MVDAHKDAKTPGDEETEFDEAVWNDVLDVLTKFHAEVTMQSRRYGRIISTPCLKKLVGSQRDHRNAVHRIALRLYGLWLVDPEQALSVCEEIADEEFEKDIPEGRVETGGIMKYSYEL